MQHKRLRKAGLALTSALAVLALLGAFSCAAADDQSQKDTQVPSGLRDKPRAIVTYVSCSGTSLAEFRTMLHASWVAATSSVEGSYYKLDLIVAVEYQHYSEVAAVCDELSFKDGQLQDSVLTPDKSQCLAYLVRPPGKPTDVPAPSPVKLINTLADDALFEAFLTHNYGYVIKTDGDTFVTPTLLRFYPEQFMFGVDKYPVHMKTATLLGKIATTLKVPGSVRHHLGPTWYGQVSEVVALAKAVAPVIPSIVSGGPTLVAQRDQAVRDPRPRADVLATAVVATSTLTTFNTTTAMDAHVDSDGVLSGFYHIRLRPQDKALSKVDVFLNRYQWMDLSRQDASTVHGFCLTVALSTWRELPESVKAAAREIIPAEATADETDANASDALLDAPADPQTSSSDGAQPVIDARDAPSANVVLLTPEAKPAQDTSSEAGRLSADAVPRVGQSGEAGMDSEGVDSKAPTLAEALRAGRVPANIVEIGDGNGNRNGNVASLSENGVFEDDAWLRESQARGASTSEEAGSAAGTVITDADSVPTTEPTDSDATTATQLPLSSATTTEDTAVTTAAALPLPTTTDSDGTSTNADTPSTAASESDEKEDDNQGEARTGDTDGDAITLSAESDRRKTDPGIYESLINSSEQTVRDWAHRKGMWRQ